jgi:hypothetical protein
MEVREMKSNIVKKVVSLILTVALVFSGTIGVFADDISTSKAPLTKLPQINTEYEMDGVNISVNYTPGDKYIVVNIGENTEKIEASYIEKIISEKSSAKSINTTDKSSTNLVSSVIRSGSISGFAYTFYSTNIADLRHPWQIAKFARSSYDTPVMAYADYIDDAIISLTNLKITLLAASATIVGAIVVAIKDGGTLNAVIAIAVATTAAAGGLYYEQMCAREIAQALFYANREYSQIR